MIIYVDSLTVPEPKSEPLMISTGLSYHQSRRNMLLSITSGVASLASIDSAIVHNLPSHRTANAATGSKSLRAYHVQPDSGAKLNPTLEELTVSEN
jgi:hypothetical protein